MRHVKEEPTCNNEQAVDLISAVEQLHGLSSQELNKLLRDSENLIIQRYTENGLLVQIDMERLAWSLPLHLIAVLLSPSRDDNCLRYLLCGFRLLHSLCDVASRHARLEQILLEEVKVTEQIMDLVFYMLVVLGRYGQEKDVTSFVPPLHSALVACSLHLLTGYISSQWQDLVHILLAHPKVDVFMDVAFDAVCVDIRFLQTKLSPLNTDVLCKKSIPPTAEQTVRNLCQQCEASLQFLQSLCQQKLFRERLLRNKEVCREGGVLSLARAVLKLDIAPPYNEISTVVAAVSRLKSKVLSILLQLCEAESLSYLDEVASSPRTMQLAKSVALEVIELLKTAFVREPKQLNVCFDKTCPRGVAILNSLRLADILSDDSNFRSFITNNFTRVLAEMFSQPYGEFLSIWCTTDLPVTEEDATLEYDPFSAAGVVLVSFSTGFGVSISKTELPNETNTESPFTLNNMPQTSYAQQRTSLLVKIIANLHCFVPNICEEQERNLFFNNFLDCLQMEPPKSSPTCTYDAQKTAKVCQNLCSLLNHAASLIPNFLNEDDVQLLRVFFTQLQSLIIPSQIDANQIQEQILESTFVDSICWEFSSHGISEHHCQEAKSMEGFTPPTRKVDPKAQEVAPDLNDKSSDLKEGMSENSALQEEDQFNVTSNSMDLANEVIELDRRKDKGATSRTASGSLREIDKDVQNIETSGSDSSFTRGKNSNDQMLDNGDFPKLDDHIKESGSKGVAQENEKTETMQGEEKQRRKRKRNIMNDKQITLIEHALVDEPEMQRNAALLQSWADKLSIHGSELTSSQLKNWLNNRKARLARAARDIRAPLDGENVFPDKPGGAGLVQFYDSPESPSEDFYVPSTTRGRSNQSTPKFGGVALKTGSSDPSENTQADFVDFAGRQSMQMNSSLRYVRCEPGQHVLIMDGEGKEVGKGKVNRTQGKWDGKSLEEAGICIVDVLELKVERWTKLQHPSETTGTTFDEAEVKYGTMRVAWDANKIIGWPQ